eukprot:scaffold267502_cov30-Tisochrysis_lutea.AAC.1
MGSRRVGGQLLERRAERHGEGLKASMVRMDWKVEKHREERRARCRVLLECPQHHLQWKWCLVLNRRPICTLPISVQLPTDDTSLYGHVNDMDLLLVAHSCDEAFCKPKGTGNSPARSSVEDAVNEAAVALSDLSLKETGLDDSHSASPASLLLTIRPIIAPAGFEAVALVVQPSHNGFVKGNGAHGSARRVYPPAAGITVQVTRQAPLQEPFKHFKVKCIASIPLHRACQRRLQDGSCSR